MNLPNHLQLADRIGESLSDNPPDDVIHALLIVLSFVLRTRGMTMEQIIPVAESVFAETEAPHKAALGRMN